LINLSFLKSTSSSNNLVEYINNISTSLSELYSSYNNNVIGDLTGITNTSAGFNIRKLIVNRNKIYLKSATFKLDQLKDFSSNLNVIGPDNKVTIVTLLVKIGKLYDNLLVNKTLIEVLGNFIPNNNNINTVSNLPEFISVSQSLNYIHSSLNKQGVFNKLPL
jgi:hypothetical protein